MVGPQSHIRTLGSKFQGTKVSISQAGFFYSPKRSTQTLTITLPIPQHCDQVWARSCSFRWLGRRHSSPLWRVGAEFLLWKRRPKIKVNVKSPGLPGLALSYFLPVLLKRHCPHPQLSKKATESDHLRHRPDQTDLHAAGLIIQGDSGAAALLWRQEEPSNHSNDEDCSDLQQGQLCLRSWKT